MKVIVLVAIALAIAFATAALARPPGSTNNLILPPRTPANADGGVGTGVSRGAPHTSPIGGEPTSTHFDPLAQTLSSSSIARLEVELQRLMQTW
jgi:hypothetical protein